MKLTTQNVEDVVKDCLYDDENEDTSNAIEVMGAINAFGFNPENVKRNKQNIKDMLSELPDEFQQEMGGGWSFLNAAQNKNGEQWGEHSDVELLLVLGLATEQIRYSIEDREMWAAFPGGMPYFMVVEEETIH